MSRNPRNTNRAQQFLYNQGERSLGDSANVMNDHLVRQEGARRVAKHGAKAAGVLALTAATLVAGFNYTYDRSDTINNQDRLEQARLLAIPHHPETQANPETQQTPQSDNVETVDQP